MPTSATKDPMIAAGWLVAVVLLYQLASSALLRIYGFDYQTGEYVYWHDTTLGELFRVLHAPFWIVDQAPTLAEPAALAVFFGLLLSRMKKS